MYNKLYEDLYKVVFKTISENLDLFKKTSMFMSNQVESEKR